MPEGHQRIFPQENAGSIVIESVEAGRTFKTLAPDAISQTIVVTKVEDDAVTIDINHPLADFSSIPFDMTKNPNFLLNIGESLAAIH